MSRKFPIFSNLIFIFLMVSFAAGQTKQTVRVAPGYATVIVCPAPPDLVTVGNVDAFSVQSAGNYILVKPLVSKGTTNMFIKAGVESYNLLLQIAEKPDLEVRLSPSQNLLPRATPEEKVPGKEGKTDSESDWKNASAARRKPLTSLNPKAVSALASLFKTVDRSSYSVNNSKIVFAIDHLKQIKDKLFVIGTIINNSNVQYDVAFVRFKMIDYARSYVFWKKKMKEIELEPNSEYYNPTVKPHTTGRLLFIFDKQGFSQNSTLHIKCTEENGRRDLVLEVPGSIIE